MSGLTITITTNAAQARARLRQIQAQIEGGAHGVVNWARQEIERTAKDSLTWPKSGIHHPHLPNRSSAPGEAPAYQYGPLSAGIVSKMVAPLRGQASSTVYYAGFLEGGTSKMAARPHMQPALDRTTPEFIKRLVAMIEGA